MEKLGGEKLNRGGIGEQNDLGGETKMKNLGKRVLALREELTRGTREKDIPEEYREMTRDAVLDYEERQGRAVTRGEMQAIMRAEPSFYGLVQRDAEGNLYNNVGSVFERGLTSLIIQEFGYKEEKQGIFMTKIRDESTRESNIAQDVLEGADVMIYQLPVDITLNPGKGGEIGSVNDDGEVTEGFRPVGDVGGVRISSGFRKTNGARELKTPVCVILFESRERMPVEEMLDVIRQNSAQFRELTDEALGSYWDYADAMETAA